MGQYKISKDELLDEIRRLKSELGRTPKKSEMDELGEYSGAVYTRRFDSWGVALIEADCEPNRARGIPDEYLGDELRRLANEIGHPPSELDIRKECLFDPETYRRRFGSTAEARKAAGLKANPDFDRINGISEGELISALYELAAELSRPPTASEIDEQCRYSAKTYERRFGSIKQARVAAGFRKDVEKANPKKIDEDRLLAEIRRLAAEIGHVPRTTDVQERSRYSRTAFENNFESWSDAVEAAGFTYKEYLAKIGADTSEQTYYGSSWAKRRKQALVRDDYECRRCSITESEHQEIYGCSLHVHHQTPFRKFDNPEEANALENLQSLCAECHVFIERQQYSC